ncbi:hypothetical protein C0991_005836 [Blastosporella zonata]|nr:hypothetical protein C0991_005836 [Blastosporella zonata]
MIINDLDLIIAKGIPHNHSMLSWFGVLCTVVVTSLLPLTQIKAVYRLDVVSFNGWVPTIRQAEPTHLERASERLEARTSNQQKIGLFLFAVAIYYFFPLQKLAAIPAKTLPLKPDNQTLLATFPTCVLYSMDLVGMLLQIILNWRSRSFGGKTPISALLALSLHMLYLAVYVPGVVGTFNTREALNVQELVETSIALIMAWQSLTFPSPREVSEGDHVE